MYMFSSLITRNNNNGHDDGRCGLAGRLSFRWPGIPFTSLSQILPFILVGIGVDDAFVIVAAYDHTDPSLPVVERVALGVKRCGVSITCEKQ